MELKNIEEKKYFLRKLETLSLGFLLCVFLLLFGLIFATVGVLWSIKERQRYNNGTIMLDSMPINGNIYKPVELCMKLFLYTVYVFL